MAESHSIDVDFQPDINVEAKPTQEFTFYCPLHIVREYDESEYEFDEEVLDEQEVIPSWCAIDCADEINDFIQDYSEPEEEHRGLMVYFDRNPVVSEKVFSAIPSVKEINGELMGVSDMFQVHSPCGGICRIKTKIGDVVERGQVIAEILNAKFLSKSKLPKNQRFFRFTSPLIVEGTVIFKLVKNNNF